MSYTHEMIIRDVVYYFHECAAYQSIAYDLDYTPLLGPYWEYFDDEEELVREGTLLIFIGMLREWLSHAGFPFGTSPDGVCAHPLPSYLTSLIAAYERAHSAQDPAGGALMRWRFPCAHTCSAMRPSIGGAQISLLRCLHGFRHTAARVRLASGMRCSDGSL